jgi:hypothetical protein
MTGAIWVLLRYEMGGKGPFWSILLKDAPCSTLLGDPFAGISYFFGDMPCEAFFDFFSESEILTG